VPFNPLMHSRCTPRDAIKSHCCTTFQSTDRQYLGQWAELYQLGIRPATSAYLKIHWHHCRVSVATDVSIVALLYFGMSYSSAT